MASMQFKGIPSLPDCNHYVQAKCGFIVKNNRILNDAMGPLKEIRRTTDMSPF